MLGDIEDEDTLRPVAGSFSVRADKVKELERRKLEEARETAVRNLEVSKLITGHLEIIVSRGGRRELDAVNILMTDQSKTLTDIERQLRDLVVFLDTQTSKKSMPTDIVEAEPVEDFRQKTEKLIRRTNEYLSDFFKEFGESNFTDENHLLDWFVLKLTERKNKGVMTADQAKESGIQKREGEQFVRVGNGTTYINSEYMEIVIFANIGEVAGEPVLIFEIV